VSRWLLFGSGVGIEITPRDLRCSVAKVRAKGAETLATHIIENYPERPATEWGNEYAAFLKQHSLSHAAAYAILPRPEVTVRVLNLPALKGADLEAAVRYQVDGLHPYPDEDVAFSFARIGETGAVLVAITRHEVVEKYTSLFAEAGVTLAGFTVSASALWAGRRIAAPEPYPALIAMAEAEHGLELYGESDAKPVYSAVFSDISAGRTLALAQAELRLPEDTAVAPLPDLATMAALSSAVPRASLPLNLLPESMRRDHSKLWLIPTVALLTVLAILGGLLAYQWRYENQKLLAELETDIKRLEPRAQQAAQLDQRAATARAQIAALDGLRARTRADLDSLQELTRILPPPAWANGLYLNETVVTVSGEAQQSETLLKMIDESARFKNSEFTTAPGRTAAGNEVFQLRSQRETPVASAAPPAPTQAPASAGPPMGGPPR